MKFPDLFSGNEGLQSAQIGWVPGNLFFYETVELPEGIETAEIDSFVELELEEHSPFPLEQLVWGYFEDFETRSVFIFSSVKPRIPASVLDDWDEWKHVYPSFLPLIERRFHESTLIGLWHENVVTLAYYNGRSPFPVRLEHAVVTAQLEADTSEGSVDVPNDADDSFELRKQRSFAAFQELRAECGEEGYLVDTSLYTIAEESVSDAANAQFNIWRYYLDREEPEELMPLALTAESGLWSADLRSADYVVKQLKLIEFDHKLWKGYQLTAWAAALLVVLLFANAGFAYYAQSRKAHLESRKDEENVIIEQKNYLANLRQFAAKPFKPIQLLESLNAVRPSGIYFESALTEAKDGKQEVAVRGWAERVKQFNDYETLLIDSEQFEKIDSSSGVSSDGRVKFTLRLLYLPEASPEVKNENG